MYERLKREFDRLDGADLLVIFASCSSPMLLSEMPSDARAPLSEARLKLIAVAIALTLALALALALTPTLALALTLVVLAS